MKTRLFVLMLCFSVSLYAQEDKQITEIKNNGNYLFAENIADSWSDAEDAAKKILMNNAMQLMADSKLPIDAVVLENAVMNAEIVELVNNNQAHIFCYIAKSEIIPGYASSASTQKVPVDVPISKNEPVATTSSNTVQPAPAAPIVSESRQQVVDDPVSVIESTTVVVTPQPAVYIAPVDPIPSDTNGSVLNQILPITKMAELNQLLAQLQGERFITVGRISSMHAPEKSYIIIYNDTERVAVLDKGTDKRRNLLTGQLDDSVSNYKGMRAMWFQIANR